MTERPNNASVTAITCTCGCLQRLAADPQIPVEYDKTMNEYHLLYRREGRSGHLMLYHCPFCGGAAPPSRRDATYSRITKEEFERLATLTMGLTNVEEAVAKFGPPDEDNPDGITLRSHSDPSKTRTFRTLKYGHLSDTADVTLIVYTDGQPLSARFDAKWIGDSRSPS